MWGDDEKLWFAHFPIHDEGENYSEKNLRTPSDRTGDQPMVPATFWIKCVCVCVFRGERLYLLFADR